MKKIIALIFLFFLTISCDKEEAIIDITEKCQFYCNILTTCFYGSSGSEYDEVVFKTNDSFQEFGNKVKIFPVNLNCDTARLPEVDFLKYSLLSKRTIGYGCSASYERKIIKDTKNKVIRYKIVAIYKGDCKMILGSRNWAYVPKIPDNFTVEFILK